ncbi:ccaat/enhancer-binding protein-related [Anaeramoeba flamelloides]|uniref:Ccaat/enhancer-binding protein-related n=1 Tax=Anaeramoeba flamelloides TaxID=1746091 RepID=A0ABQ8XQK9_9EUKA|nr:ccaat/enhancer-binding protein-related [Anaeramoeba flamelloides]
MSTYSTIPSLDFMPTDFGKFGLFEPAIPLIGEPATIEMAMKEKILEITKTTTEKPKSKPTPTATNKTNKTNKTIKTTKTKPKSKTTPKATTETTKPNSTRKRKKPNTKAISSEEILKRKRELNRISARKSREKKKMYISQIEREVDELRQERERLIKLVNSLNQEVERQRKRSDTDLLFHLLQKKFGIDSSLFTTQLNNSYHENHNSQNN